MIGCHKNTILFFGVEIQLVVLLSYCDELFNFYRCTQGLGFSREERKTGKCPCSLPTKLRNRASKPKLKKPSYDIGTQRRSPGLTPADPGQSPARRKLL